MNSALTIAVLGAGVAGMAAAARARRVNPQARLLLFEQGPVASLAVCGLPYLISGEVADPAALILESADELRERRAFELYTRHRVVGLDLAGRRLSVLDLERNQTRSVAYDRLVLTPGGRPRLQLPGALAPNCMSLRSLEDALRIRAWLEQARPRRVLIVGGGYLGLELAEAVRRRGLQTVVVQEKPVCFEFEPELHRALAEHLAGHGVELLTGTPVCELVGPLGGRAEFARLADGRELPADFFLVAVGLDPAHPSLAGLKLRRGQRGGLLVDRRGETSQAGVYAAGDCVEVYDALEGRPVYAPLAGPAVTLGRLAGENAAGGQARYAGALASVAIRLFDQQAARTGYSAEAARRLGYQVQVSLVQGRLRPGYLGGGPPLHLALVYEAGKGRLLGAQAFGPEAGARVNLAATAMAAGASVEALASLDLTYTPTLSPLWDPFRVAARQAAT